MLAVILVQPANNQGLQVIYARGNFAVIEYKFLVPLKIKPHTPFFVIEFPAHDPLCFQIQHWLILQRFSQVHLEGSWLLESFG